MRSLDAPLVEVTVDSLERHDVTGIPSNSNNGGNHHHVGLGETKHLMERLNTAQVKVKRLQRLEAALVDFFMEIMDRSENNANDKAMRFNDSESSFARGKRKEQFLKKAEGDPISLLNALRTHLRLRFAEQEAQQAATTRRVHAEDLANQQKEQNARDKLQQLELTCQQLKEQQNSLIQQLNQHEVDQTRTRRQHQMILEKLNAQVQEGRSREQAAKLLVAKQQQEIATLKEAREALIIQKTLEGTRTTTDANSSNSATTAAPAGFGTSPSHTKGDFFGTPAENQTLRRALRKYEVKMAQTEATNEERKREVQRLQQQLTGLRQSTQLQTYSRLEKETRHLRELADDLKKRLAESEADALRTKGAFKEREIQVQKMKDEYARLFNALQKQKQPAHYSPPKLTRSASSAQLSAAQQNHSPRLPPRLPAGITEAVDNAVSATPAHGEHPYVVEYYRSEAARVERESEALKLRIRHMMASEQLHKQKTRVLRTEKQNLMRERDQLRADLDRAKKHNTLQSIAMNRQRPHSSAETRKVAFTTAPQEMKKLQDRNAFLEERFRKSLQSNAALTTIGVVARLRNSISVPCELEDPGPLAIPENENDAGVADAALDEAQITRHNPASKIRPASAQATTVNKNSGGSFRSLDAATLRSLQRVTRATRVRPQSANSIKIK
ncbi:hypothetical protein L917_16714 [Phytophthora nicotianae]|uniref:Uncharacterized protein n=4 Tax=Phytophthora nicotianae TaxID=4792 RepID=W2R145_PHYN3|nr:hypothetical protein PPTG_03892 [Phytophthora nicotianae INRA-310]ETI36442.1 hypothetical protein F443_17461 [Phytophthora nicotianae P1569]ETL83316.1 hypothetical protein L917_16714 [Phytophthora nicotianae]ETN18225.1 hypothetical protein PPTG_03892 [Phytophthora nicotianae INRA-310]ETO65143.1 hypothetical protein F444_17498 [Phytophthora nicotianae P1976]